jgi:hypothetical protein
MVSPLWLEELRKQLDRQKLPPLYIERLIQELRDHYDDITQENIVSAEPEKNIAAHERMGQPAPLAEVVAEEYRKAPFPLTISRKRIVTTDLVIGLVAGLIIAMAMSAFTWYSDSLIHAAIFPAVLPLGLYVAMRRYLRSITFDSVRKILFARSIFPWITFTIPFADVKVARNVKIHGGYILTVRRPGMIQPLLFEVWTAEEDRDAQSFMAVLLSHGLNVKQEGAASGVA